jgi:hypothetical protein
MRWLLLLLIAGCSCSQISLVPATEGNGWFEKGPLLVSHNLDADDVEIVEDAIDYWNQAASCLVFELSSEDPDVVITKSGKLPRETRAQAECSAGQCVIRFPGIGSSPSIDTMTVVHELGHAMRLPHDPWNESVMYEKGGFSRSMLIKAHQADVARSYCQ